MEASRRHILRYTVLAEEMAGHCQDPQRQQELLATAAIPHHNTQHRPTDFPQACQLFWYSDITLQHRSSVSSILLGRFDQYMLLFYQASLNRGQDPAYLKESSKSLWAKCDDIVLLRFSSSTRYSTGFSIGCTALFGGLTGAGRSMVNVLSFLCLDAYQNVQLPQPNPGVWVNESTDCPFLRRTAGTAHLGTGIPQTFNDEMVVSAFLNHGVSLKDVHDYAVIGCVEFSVPGHTYGLHDIATFDPLKVMETVSQENEHQPDVSWGGLICQIRDKARYHIKPMIEGSNICDIGHRDQAPIPPLFPLIENYVQRGKDITVGGACYNFSGVQDIGVANLSNLLYALKGMVFDQQRFSSNQLMAALKTNFQMPEGEKVHARLINRFDKYGNDIDDVDNIGADLLRFYCKEVEQYLNSRDDHFILGPYAVPAHVPLGSVVSTIPDGRPAGERPTDGGLSPMVGQDSQGPTVVPRSVSKLDNYLLSNGTLLNVKFTPAMLAGDSGLNELTDFLQVSCRLKLQHIQFNVVDADTLREAQQRPQDFAGLVVQIAGYSASLVELPKEIQDNATHRTAHQL